MARTTRSRNLDLIRWLHHGHERTAKKLASVTNANYLSKMATAEMEVTDKKARSIEKALDLGAGWLDRDNVAILNMSPTEWELHQLIAALTDEVKAALLGFLSSLEQ